MKKLFSKWDNLIINQKWLQENFIPIANDYKPQRKIDKSHVKTLIRKMSSEHWTSAQLAIAIEKSSGMKYFLNGYHSCYASLECKLDFIAQLQIWETDSPADTAMLFSQFDNNKRRTIINQLDAFLPAFNIKWNSFSANRMIQSLMFLGKKLGTENDEKATNCIKFKKEGDYINNYIDGPNRKIINRNPIIAALITCLNTDMKAGNIFWITVRDAIGCSVDDPELILRNHLVNEYKINKKPTKSEQYVIYNTCIQTWNSWRSSKELDMKPDDSWKDSFIAAI
jgi:hypothetical protein